MDFMAKISAEDMEDAKLETSHQLRREMDEKAKAELLALAVGRNKEVETGVRYEQAADDTEDAYEPDDVVDDGADDGAYDAEAEEAERAEIARRNQDLLKLAMANNEVVQVQQVPFLHNHTLIHTKIIVVFTCVESASGCGFHTRVMCLEEVCCRMCTICIHRWNVFKSVIDIQKIHC